MSPFLGREPAVTSRTKPTGGAISFPMCGDWTCDDEVDWDVVGPDDPEYAEVKLEQRIAHYHEPRDDWRRRLKEERDKRSGGDPLWWGRP